MCIRDSARTWHVQLSLLWTAASFLAAGIFLAPYISGREPKRQHWLAYGLLGALAVVIAGSFVGEAMSIFGVKAAEGRCFGISSGSTLTCRKSGKACSWLACSCGSRSSTAASAPA